MSGTYNNENKAKFCSNCGAQVPGDKKFCAKCGAKIVHAPQPAQQPSQQQQARPMQSPRQFQQAQPVQPPKRRGGKKKVIIIILAVILAVVAGVAGYAYFFLRSALDTAPDMRAAPRGSRRIPVTEISQGSGSRGNTRNTSKYTFLVLGADEGEYNTDVIMVVTLDTANHTLDVVSIPRDTLVNVSWNLKKANSILANMRASKRGEEDAEAEALQATVEMFADIIGYEVDYWVIVNLQAFVALVDAIGGVDFHVPVNMNYDDRAGGLSIHYTEGTHHLSGQQAMEVLRFRSGYASADIGRIGTQQSFLKSVAEQILEKRNSISVTRLARIFLENVKTDLKLDDLIWFGNEFLKLDPDDVNFHTMPGNAAATVRYQSYVTIYVEEWLELINDRFNPFSNDITENDVSILTRGDGGRFYVTDGNRRGDPSWGT